MAAFCRRARVPQASFYAWRRRLQSPASFVEIKLPAEACAEASAIELRLSDGHCVLVRSGFDRHTLRDLLATLEASQDDRERARSAEADAPQCRARGEARR
jgi:hypothetical protein